MTIPRPSDVADRARWFLLEAYPDAIQFEGPASALCFGYPYTVLGLSGVVTEGETLQLADTAEEAIAAHFEQLRIFCEGVQQIAWRRPTELAHEPNHNQWRITSRLAVFR